MSASVVANSCRLTIISATLRVDLAVPSQISVGELLTIVVSSLGRETADRGAAEGGWVLQRAAEAPLDPSSSLAANQLRDGDALHLRTRSTHLPEVAFDDVLDAVATGVLTRTPRWVGEHTMRAASTFAGALLVFTLGVLLLVGPTWLPSTIASGVIAVLLILTAVAVARVYHRRVPALAAGTFAVAFAAVSGLTGLGGHHQLLDFGAPQVLVGVCAAALAAMIMLAFVGSGLSGFVAVVSVSLLTAVATTIATASPLSAPATASITATVALAMSPFLPTLSFRLSRLPLPTIVQDATDLRRETGTIDSNQILGQAVRADQFLTGLVAGVSLAIAGAAILICAHGVSERILAVVLGVICLLRARLFTGRTQRAALLVSGGLALLGVLVAGTLDLHGSARILGFAVPAAVAAVILFALAVRLPDRRYAPPVARAADILESLLVLSVIPLALGVMGVYGAARGLAPR
ncbi:MAG: type VII secretion integral membrane protein EccD [Jatrophihabitans sp.]